MKTAAIIFISLAVMHSLHAQKITCRVLSEMISGAYSGDCKDGLANGKGKSSGEETYIGHFSNGLPHGKGKYYYKNGDIFQGYWENGKKNGVGKLKYISDGKMRILSGYWKDDEYAGVTDPEISYRITNASGLVNHRIVKSEITGGQNNELTLLIKSAFTDFVPFDLKLDISSGQIIQSGKKFIINKYFCPFHCEVSYSILVGNHRKKCRFNFDIPQYGRYTIIMYND